MTLRGPGTAADPIAGSWTEVLEGFVVDLECVGTAPRDTLALLAARHPRACALAAAFSGTPFALVDHDGGVHVLDNAATRLIIAVLWRADDSGAVAVHVRRVGNRRRMQTVAVSELNWASRGAAVPCGTPAVVDGAVHGEEHQSGE